MITAHSFSPSPLRAVGSYPPSGLEALTGWKPACKPYPPAWKHYGLEAGLEAEPEAIPSPLEGEGEGEGAKSMFFLIKFPS